MNAEAINMQKYMKNVRKNYLLIKKLYALLDNIFKNNIPEDIQAIIEVSQKNLTNFLGCKNKNKILEKRADTGGKVN